MITPEQIEATRQTLRRAVLRETLVLELRTAGRDDTGRHRPFLVALDALVAFERAEAAMWAVQGELCYCGRHPYQDALAQIIKDTGAVQE